MATFGLPTLLIENLDTATASRTTVGNTTIATVPAGQIWKIRKIELYRQPSSLFAPSEVNILRVSNTTIGDIDEDIDSLIVKFNDTTGVTFGDTTFTFIDDPYYNIKTQSVSPGVGDVIAVIDFKEDYLLLRPADILRLNLAVGIDARTRITYDRYTQV